MVYGYSLRERPAQSRRAGRLRRIVSAVALCAAIPCQAQDTSRTALLDSLARQLQRAEARIEVLERQVASQASSGVQARSGARIELSGRLLVNAFGGDADVNNADNPQFVLPTATATPGGLGMTPRHSTLRLAAIVPEVAGGTFVGDIDVDFHGGQQPSSGGRTFPLIRLRTLRATLRGSHVEVMAGQEVPVIAPHNPVSLASIGTPGFAAAGNLWLWLPQLRVTAQTTTPLRLGVQGAVLAPTSGESADAFETDYDAAERSRRPYLQGRLRAAWGDPGFGGEIGCGAHIGWLSVTDAAANGSLVRSHAVACDARVPVGTRLELRGEGYSGQALRGLGGGGIGQSLGAANTPVRDRGGWLQLIVKPSFLWSVGVGCGVDDPNNDDLGNAGRLENQACAAHLQLRPAGPLVIGAEGRRIATSYAAGRRSTAHFNLAIGFEY